MATLRIAEVTGFANSPFAAMPPAVEQVVTFTTSTQSAALTTRYVRVTASAACVIAFGADPTAAVATGSIGLTAGVAEYFGVTIGHKIAAVTV